MNIHQGNILNGVSDGIVVHGCNAQGKMNSGIAGQIHARFPSVFEDYWRQYESSGLKLGDVVVCPPNTGEGRSFWIANAITQEFYGRDSSIRYVDYNAVRDVFSQVAQIAKANGLTVHYPKVGAGLANGQWEVIEKIIETELQGMEHHLWLWEG